MQNLYTFIHGSSHRNTVFTKIQRDCSAESSGSTLSGNESSGRERRLKALHDVRWYSHNRALQVIDEQFDQIIDTLDTIQVQNSTKSNVSSEAKGLKVQMDFEFILCLLVFLDILNCVNSASVYLQKETLDFACAVGAVQSCLYVCYEALEQPRNVTTIFVKQRVEPLNAE